MAIDIKVPTLGESVREATVGPDGRVYLSWLEPANPGYSLRFAVHDGTRWSPAQTIVTRSDFFGPMAVAMMGGIVVATVLTLGFLPALYAAWFRVRPVKEPN